MALTEEQKAKIANRQKALERLKARGVVSGSTVNRIEKHTSGTGAGAINVNAIKQLTEEQRRKIEANRQKALAKLKEKQQNFRNASESANPALSGGSSSAEGQKKRYNPSVITSQYIEYDLSKMKDSKGGFIGDEPQGTNGQEKTFDEWREEQRVVRDLPPPMDMENAIKCFECGTFEIDQKFWETFKCRVCRRCTKNNPDKYSLLTKTECKEDYFLTDPELEDTSLLCRMFKPNPHSTFNRMQLFLRYQVEEFAFKKWGGPEGLDKEWQKREEGKVKRRDKKFEMKMKEMRKKTRAEEYNRRLREGKYDDHKHEFSNAVAGGTNEDGLPVVKRRCLMCGFETEEVSL
ncbi:DNA repair protein RAD14 [Cyberlindnera fabianii]|uniref:DNA repair protein RAD14 n=1 Tax=Cyberlindnera fabianii TaxID=36022 RepID=A0A1V2L8Q2_CYBFA|nr:DNA repair protein RAD14 [Cyberlindnera fabianii]